MSWLLACGIGTEEHAADELWPDCSLEAMNCAGPDTNNELETQYYEQQQMQYTAREKQLLERGGSTASSVVSKQRTDIQSDRSAIHSMRSELLDKENALNSQGSASNISSASVGTGGVVRVPGKFSLQEAIEIAQETGATVVVSAGTHRLRKDVVIDGPVRIMGEGQTTIHGCLLCVEGSSGFISGIQVVSETSEEEGSAAVVISGGNWTLKNCVFLTAEAGNDALQVGGDSKVTLERCALGTNNDRAFTSSGSAALWVNGFATVKASECTMTGMEKGAYVHGCSNTDFKFCTFTETTTALVLRDRAVAAVKRCEFVNNVTASFAVAEGSTKLDPQRTTLVASDNKFRKSAEWASEARPWKLLHGGPDDGSFKRVQSAMPYRSIRNDDFLVRGGSSASGFGRAATSAGFGRAPSRAPSAGVKSPINGLARSVSSDGSRPPSARGSDGSRPPSARGSDPGSARGKQLAGSARFSRLASGT